MALLSAISIPQSHNHHENSVVKSQSLSPNLQSGSNKSLKLEKPYNSLYSNLKIESSLSQLQKPPPKEAKHHDTSFLLTPPNSTKLLPDLKYEECSSHHTRSKSAKACFNSPPSPADPMILNHEQALTTGHTNRDNHDLKHTNRLHHTHQNKNISPIEYRSRFTNILLLGTKKWPLLHAIILEKDSRRIFYFMSLNFCFMLVQAFYGYLTDSLGLLSDSIHMFFDCLAIGVGLFASIARKWPPSPRFPFGFGMIEYLSGFGNGLFLILISIEILTEATERLLEGRETKRLGELFTVSSLGLAVNLIGMACFGHHGHAGHDCGGHSHLHNHNISDTKLTPCDNSISLNYNVNTHGHDDRSYDKNNELMHDNTHTNIRSNQKFQIESHNTHTHSHCIHSHPHITNSHSHSTHSHTHPHNTQHDSHEDDNMHGIFLHVLADTMGSAAVLISTVLIHFTGFNGWDPIASCIIAILIFLSSIPLIKSSAKKLLLTLPDDREYTLRDTLAKISELRGVSSYYAPRFWLVDRKSEKKQEMINGVVHIVATRGSGLDELRQRVQEFLKTYNVDAVIQVERDLDSNTTRD